MTAEPNQCNARSTALIVEDDPLTLWSLRSYLNASFSVEIASTIDDALLHLKNPDLAVVICGSPIVDSDPIVLQQLAQNAHFKVVALVSDTSRREPDNVIVVEKPFALEQLAKILGTCGSRARS